MTPTQRLVGRSSRCAAAAGLLAWVIAAQALVQPPPGPGLPAITDSPTTELEEVQVIATEPRYVAPTRRDSIGRIWAPVVINGRGPYRLVLDTGASHSGVTEEVASSLGIPLQGSHSVLLRGVTGSMPVPTIHVETLSVGDLEMDATMLPIVTDALGGAEGVLGSEGLFDKRIYIDFRHDLIMISQSRNQRAGLRFFTVPFQFSRGNLLMVHGMIGDAACSVIIDTGAQTSIGNLALRRSVVHRGPHFRSARAEIQGVTDDVQRGDFTDIPPIVLGELKLTNVQATFGDMRIFEHWNLMNEPTLLLGMDALGVFDTLIIDYRRHELQIRPWR
jgi:predicted aspartyl protease